jgi:hypothetical protein
MARKSTSDLPALVDAFVRKINSDRREPGRLDEVPEYLRESASDPASEPIDGWTNWCVIRRDNSARIEQLEKQTGRPFPPSFQYLLANYSFPAFEFGPLMFFANTGEDTFWELGKRLFQDKHMSPHLLAAGFLQIGNPFFYNYDPVCFDTKSPRIEKRIVQLDHEAILQHSEMHVVKEIAPSFLELIDGAVRRDLR